MSQGMLRQPLKVACVQLKGSADKAANIANAGKKIAEAAQKGAKLVVLPECWNSPYAVTAFPEYAEQIPGGETSKFMAEVAKKNNIFLIGGSIPEKLGDKIYNTSLSFDPEGEIIGKHQKVHLFDIDVPGKIRFQESETLSAGNKATLVDLKGYGKVGVAICYDIRFPEMSAMAAHEGAFALVYPGAFNLTTGPLHWQLLGRARAVDNETYVILASPARDMSASYHAYGHSQVIDPWGTVLAEAGDSEDIIYAELDPAPIEEVRKSIPVYDQRRFDIYPDVAKGTK